MTTDLPALATDAGLLTDALRRSGVLGTASVREVMAETPREMILSRIVRLRLVYDGTTGSAAGPASLILKTRRPGGPAGTRAWGEREVAFYGTAAAAMPPRLVPRCYDFNWHAATHDWHLLLEDLTDTHRIATVWPLPPDDGECRMIVATLARAHAAWWDDPQLGVSVGAWVDAAAGRQYQARFADDYQRFRDRLGDRLSAERRALYERFFAAIPRLGARYRSGRNLSVVHGDAHVWNFFLPRDGSGGPANDTARLFDWDAWRLGLATDDLAYMMATHWYRERRQRLEQPMLDHYHAALVEGGVSGYDRHALDDDYRLAVAWQMLTPVIQAGVGIPPAIWWNHLERILLAVDDLGCRALLD